jgi:hypothetical protein
VIGTPIAGVRYTGVMSHAHRLSPPVGLLARGAMIALVASACAGCAVVSYRHDEMPPEHPAPRTETMYYRVRPLQGLSMGGMDELKRSMKRNGVFANTELVDAPTQRGVSVDVHAIWVPPSLGAMVYGYVDVSLLGLLPLYSDSMGYDVQYTVYRDGQKVRIYEYAIRRRVFMWLPVLPFAWVNLLTGDETDAFSAITQRFFLEASRDGSFDGRSTLPGAAPAAAMRGEAPRS